MRRVRAPRILLSLLLALTACAASAMVRNQAVVSVTTGGGPTLDELLPDGGPVLRYGTARDAGLVPLYADHMVADLELGLQPGTGIGDHPEYPGGVVLAARRGVIAEYAAAGYNLRYASQQGEALRPREWIPTAKDTMYDLASLTKLFTSIVAVQLIQKGDLSLTATVASYIPRFATNGKSGITIKELLTHTSGLPPDPSPPLWTYSAHQQMVDAVYATKLTARPGSAYIYSDLNMIVLAFVEQQVTGKPLDVLVHDQITGPLQMTDTLFNPPASLRERIAAAEYQLLPDRGLVWGHVHDENAWALGGVAGNAGLFSTAHDMAILAQTLLNGGEYAGTRILSRQSVLMLMTNDNEDFPGHHHGLGLELDQNWYMGALATPYTIGHTGFTGTSIVIDPTTDSFVILLTNRVHPSRNWGSTDPIRRAMTYDLARAVAVHPASDQLEWFGGMADSTTTTLAVPVTLPASATLDFSLWYDTEPGYDFLYLEVSTDGGQTWQKVPFSIHGRRLDAKTPGKISGYEGHQWLRAWADLSAWTGPLLLRWRYTTDPLYHGRGVYIDTVQVRAGQRIVFDDRRPGDAAEFQPDGFVQTTD